ncbi:MAG: baseplate J/gp47 family protein [Candidatus Nomurabacteria bacterium]|nr:baseplate J/gp47 family protein [Candidatus Nomurabacteria bacterium]
MNKDVIYVDIDDDIADIVDKVVDSPKRLVALVLPKNIGALKSVVNLKLLARSAHSSDKLVALVTPSTAILPLASQAKLAVAKSLRDRPIIPEVAPAENPISNVIDGSEDAPIMVDGDAETPEEAVKIDEAIDDDVLKEEDDKKKKKDKSPKVPSFDKIRNRIVLIASIVGVVIVGIVVMWFVLAPEAVISVTTRTENRQLSEAVKFTTNKDEVKPEEGIFLLEEHEIVKKSEVEFAITGEKIIGEKATGKITVRNCLAGMTGYTGFTVTTNARFTSEEGLVFIPTSDTALSGWGDAGIGTCETTAKEISVVAEQIGSEYNLEAGQTFTIKNSQATFVKNSAMTGGVKKTVKVVSEEDYNLAKAGLTSVNETAGKKETLNSLSATLKPIGDETTVTMTVKEIEVIPKVGEETALTNAKMTQETVFKAHGVSASNLKDFINQKITADIEGKSELRVYDTGIEGARLDNFVSADGKFSATLKSTVKIGPNISEDQIRELTTGKKFNEAKNSVSILQSVSDVVIDFNYFWVNTVPKDFKHIIVEFKTNE